MKYYFIYSHTFVFMQDYVRKINHTVWTCCILHNLLLAYDGDVSFWVLNQLLTQFQVWTNCGPKKIIFLAGMLTQMPKSIRNMMATPQQRSTTHLSVLEHTHANSDILIQGCWARGVHLVQLRLRLSLDGSTWYLTQPLPHKLRWMMAKIQILCSGNRVSTKLGNH